MKDLFKSTPHRPLETDTTTPDSFYQSGAVVFYALVDNEAKWSDPKNLTRESK